MIESFLSTGFFYQSESASEKLEAIADQYGAVESVDVHIDSPNKLSLQTDTQWINVATDEETVNVFECEHGMIDISITCNFVTLEDNAERLEDYIATVRSIYHTTSPAVVCGMHNWRIESIGKYIPSPVTDESVANNRIECPTWLMIFPPAMVETYGREWLIDLPAERIEELDDGAIMTVATEDLVECETDTELAETVFDAMEPLEEAFGVEPDDP